MSAVRPAVTCPPALGDEARLDAADKLEDSRRGVEINASLKRWNVDVVSAWFVEEISGRQGTQTGNDIHLPQAHASTLHTV